MSDDDDALKAAENYYKAKWEEANVKVNSEAQRIFLMNVARNPASA